jgi:hypothetical protein
MNEDYLEAEWGLKDALPSPFERKVLARDTNVRTAVRLLREDVMRILAEYDAGSLIEEKIYDAFENYDGNL